MELSGRDCSLLLETSRELYALTDASEIMNVVERRARELVGADRVTFVIREGDRVYARDSASDPTWKGRPLTIEWFASGWTMLHAQDLVLEDVQGDPRIPLDARRPASVASAALVPVENDGAVAVLAAYWTTRHAATPRELALLRALGSATAAALANSEAVGALARSKACYQALLEGLPHLVWTADEQGFGTYFNARWTEFTGLSLEQSVGYGFFSAIHHEDAPRFRELWRDAIQRGQPWETECRVERREGGHVWMLVRAVRLQGEKSEWVATSTDIEARRLSEQQQAGRIRDRDEFLAVASHELRTPLTAVQLQLQGLYDLVRRTCPMAFDGRLSRRLGRASESLDRLAQLVERLLDVSRMSSVGIPLNRERFDLVHSLECVVAKLAERLGAEPNLHVLAPESVYGTWDRLRIEQVLNTLLSNAVKYGQRKPLTVEIAAKPDGVVVKVVDHGVGIPPHDLERVFERFARTAPTRHYGGLGLGLYCARLIARAHGGTLTASQTPGGGATLTLSLPFDGDSEEHGIDAS